jgi:hypothetical protein
MNMLSQNPFTNRMVWITFLVLNALSTPSGATVFPENFETGTVGTFPSQWQDVGLNDRLIDPIAPLSPVPSATVVNTTDAFGNPTKALSPVDAIARASGIFSLIPIGAPQYSSTADIRVDRFSDQPAGDGTDWAMQMSLVNLDATNFADSPQVGIYASSLSQSWRLFNISGGFDDIDTGVPITLGTWYQVSLELDNTTGNAHTLIRDSLTGATLTDRNDLLTDWAGPVGFNALAFFDGELTSTAISNRAVVDNITFTSAPVPLPAAAWLFSSGVVTLAALVRKRMSAS